MLQKISGLGAGESAAIALVIFELAAIKNLLELLETLDELAQTSFRLPPDDIIEEFLSRDNARKQAAE